MTNAPCKDCERKGCGSYHDECELYQDWKSKEFETKKRSAGEAVATNTQIRLQQKRKWSFWKMNGRKK